MSTYNEKNCPIGHIIHEKDLSISNKGAFNAIVELQNQTGWVFSFKASVSGILFKRIK